MKLKMLKKIPASFDGVAIRELVADEIIEINERIVRETELAELLTREGFAEIITDEEAAAHLKAIEELSPEEKLELAALHEEKAAAETEFAEVAKKELRETRAGKGRKSKAVEVEPVKKSEPAPAPTPPELWVPVVGDVVQEQGVGPFMTIEKLAGELAELVWFAENDHSAPKRNVFQIADLVKVKGS